jgi:hypothetical protein
MAFQAAEAPELCATLARIVPDLQRCCPDRWVLIGSAAARLAGAAVSVADIDILTDADDAAHLARYWAAHRDHEHVPADARRFRSHFSRFGFRPMPVEVMGNLEWCGPDGWHPVTVEHVHRVNVDGLWIRLPTRAEQIRLLESFARPKDGARVISLKSLSQEQS